MYKKNDVYIPVKKVPGRRGAYFNVHGYVLIQVKRGTFSLEHRVIVERVLGRKLKYDEEINHINGVKYDNRNRNLFVSSRAYHEAWHRRCYRRFGRWHPPIYDNPSELSRLAFEAGSPLTFQQVKQQFDNKAASRSGSKADASVTVRKLLGLY